MSRITPVGGKKRKVEEAMRGKTSKPRKRIRKQKDYRTWEDEEELENPRFKPVNLGDSDDEQPPSKVVKKLPSTKDQTPYKPRSKPEQTQKAESSSSDDESDAGSSSDSSSEEDEADVAETLAVTEPLTAGEQEATLQPETNDEDEDMDEIEEDNQSSDSEADSDLDSQAPSTTKGKQKSKRNDPTAFADSISKILNTKLSTTQRADPVMVRSAEAAKARATQADAKLDLKAQAKIKAERRLAKEKGRNTDVLGLERGITGEVAEKEKALRKIATKGVIQLFNAFRAAHDRAEEARREERRKGTVGMGERERKVNEQSKEGFLELITKKRSTAQ